jgi:hypothetical protein
VRLLSLTRCVRSKTLPPGFASGQMHRTEGKRGGHGTRTKRKQVRRLRPRVSRPVVHFPGRHAGLLFDSVFVSLVLPPVAETPSPVPRPPSVARNASAIGPSSHGAPFSSSTHSRPVATRPPRLRNTTDPHAPPTLPPRPYYSYSLVRRPMHGLLLCSSK